MGLTLRDFRIKNCQVFIQKLLEFEEAVKNKDIEAAINDLHVSFLVLCNSFEIQHTPSKMIYSEAGHPIKNVKIGDIGLTVSGDLVLDVDDPYSPLAPLFVNQSVDSSRDLSLLFFDYKDRCCDFCGKYFTKYTFLTPEQRLKMDDFALAYHPCCYKASMIDFYLSS